MPNFGRLVREGLSVEATFEQSPGRGEGMSHVDIWRRQVERNWASLRNSKEAAGAGVESARREW